MKQATLPALCSAALVLAMQMPLQARVSDTIKSGPEINEISQRTTLLFYGQSADRRGVAWGSGSLIAKQGDTCVGVTNAHVINGALSGDFTFVVRTFDNEPHRITNIRPFPREDLALVTFECTQNYEPITIATYQLSPGQDVYVSGWPADSGADSSRSDLIRHFTSGAISTILDTPIGGYQVGYTNVTNQGMSGGQVLDAGGRLVAIHGIGAREDSQAISERLGISSSLAAELAAKTGFNYGIPANIFLAGASQGGGNYPFDVVFSSPQAPASGAVTGAGDYVAQPDASDRVSFNDMLGNFNQLLDTFGRFRRIFGF